MDTQLVLFDWKTMVLLEDAGNHLDSGIRLGQERPVMRWPSLAYDESQFVWYTALTRSPYTAEMLERRLEREREMFIADVLSEAVAILRETVYA